MRRYAHAIDEHQCDGGTMSRVQLALNVTDLEESIGFYTKLFGVGPAKRLTQAP
jgi:hypothetical protein